METLFQDVTKDIQINYTSKMHGGQMPLVHYHNAYEIYILEQGNRSYIIDGTFIDLSDGDVALIRPYELHTTNGTAYSRHVLYFKDSYLDRYFTTEAKEKILSLFTYKKLSLESDEHKTLKALLHDLSVNSESFLTFCKIADLLLHCRVHNSKQQNSLISSIVEYVSKHYLEIENLDALADKFYITKHHLCRLFKKETGVTVVTYINTQKLQLAREQLKLTKKSIAQIAVECNFNSSMYFCKLFKETVGMTPGEYRKQMQI